MSDSIVWLINDLTGLRSIIYETHKALNSRLNKEFILAACVTHKLRRV